MLHEVENPLVVASPNENLLSSKGFWIDNKSERALRQLAIKSDFDKYIWPFG